MCGPSGCVCDHTMCIHLPTYKESAVDMDAHVYACDKECLVKVKVVSAGNESLVCTIEWVPILPLDNWNGFFTILTDPSCSQVEGFVLFCVRCYVEWLQMCLFLCTLNTANEMHEKQIWISGISVTASGWA